jgi:hypothetical protein
LVRPAISSPITELCQDAHTDKAEKSPPSNLIPSEFAAMGKKRLEELVTMQTELLENLQQLNQSRFDRIKSEAILASEYATKLTAVHSVPETASIFQEWANRRMEQTVGYPRA